MTVKLYSLKKDGNNKLSKNFTVNEFACNDGSDKILIDDVVVRYLQNLRDQYNKPVVITSGYRTNSYNKKIGGANNSYHTKGKAVDFYINGINVETIARVAESYGILGIGCYTVSKFIHIDSRTIKYFWKNDGKEKFVSTFGAKLLREQVKEKYSFSSGTINFFETYKYKIELYKKLLK